MVSFREKWLAAVDKKNSVLCAGLDLADFEMGRGVEGLPSGVKKRDWTLAYIEAVAPHSAALKPNFQYWKGEGDDFWISLGFLMLYCHLFWCFALFMRFWIRQGF